MNFKTGRSTVQEVVTEVTAVLVDILRPVYLPEPTVESFRLAAIGYRVLHGYPMCCGAIDGKPVYIEVSTTYWTFSNVVIE